MARVDLEKKNLASLLKSNENAIVRSAPRSGVDPKRLLRIAFNACLDNPLLLQADKRTLIGAIMESVKLGLTVGGPMQEAWILPFRDHGTLKAQLIVGYMGYRSLVDRSHSVVDMHPRAVYANDEFDVVFGDKPAIHHRPYWKVGATEPGPLVAVYMVAHLKGGGTQIEVMPRAEVDEHRARSRAKDSGPWVTDYDSMALKTVLRKGQKYLPKGTEELSRAMDLDDKADRGADQDFDLEGVVLDVAPVPEKQIGVGSPGLSGVKAKLAAGQSTPASPPPADESPGDLLDAEENARLDREVVESDRAASERTGKR